MNRELRILSGLHRGALLPLNEGEKLTIGSDPGCDIVLVDPGIHALVLSVQLASDGWEIERFDSKGQITDTQHLPSGAVALVCGVVLTVVDSSQVWTFISAQDAQDEMLRAQASSLQAPPTSANGQETTGRSLGGQKNKGLPAKSKRKLTQRLLVMGAVMLGFATFSLSRTVATSEQSGPQAAMGNKDRSRTADKNKPLWDALPSNPSRNSLEMTDKAVAKDSPLGSATSEYSPEKLRSMMIQRLRDAYLADKLELDLTDSAWTMRGVLDEEDSRLFGRVLAAFYKEHNVKIPLHAYVNSAEEMLPFKIQQFSGGAMGSVVTSDGQRLYVGDSHKGYTLQRIDGRRIVFAGKRKVEVIW